MSFAADTVLPDVGAVQDEDVVLYDAGTWSLYFDGTGQGLTAGGHDLDAINVRKLLWRLVGLQPPPGAADPFRGRSPMITGTRHEAALSCRRQGRITIN